MRGGWAVRHDKLSCTSRGASAANKSWICPFHGARDTAWGGQILSREIRLSFGGWSSAPLRVIVSSIETVFFRVYTGSVQLALGKVLHVCCAYGSILANVLRKWPRNVDKTRKLNDPAELFSLDGGPLV